MSGTDRARRQIFAVGRGQYENIGDVLLRRPLLDWARESGRLHVYVGRSPAGYDEGLGLQPGDVVYRSFARWYAALAATALAGTADSLYKPGELQLTLVGMKEHLAMLPAVALVRARGGRVARIGAGARNFARVPRLLMWPSNALSTYTRWRDDRTAAYLGFGPAMPDLGFGEGTDDAGLAAAIDETDRDLLLVSLRDDTEVAPRPYPSTAWFDGIRRAADLLGLRIGVVTQVSVDEPRTRRLAADLGAEVVEGWDDLDDFVGQEARLRALYRRAAVVASDRLHVIIAGVTEGAAPVGLQLDDSDKISRHFDTIGVRDVSLTTTALDADAIADGIVAIARRRGEVLRRLLDARARLHAVRADLRRLLDRAPEPQPTTAAQTTRRPELPTVYHVGRAGDIPGGMTQVVNAYLGWRFEHADVDILVSRGDPGHHVTAARRYLEARRRLTAIARERERPAVVVVHLSERGSFVREGSLARHAARLGLPVIAHLHGSEFAPFEQRRPGMVARALSVCAHVISLSEESTRIAARHVGADHVTLVPNAIPSGAEAIKGRTVVFGGVVSARKGIDVLQEAWRRVSGEFPDWTLLIAGPVRDAELVDPALPGARFLGSVPHARLMTLLDEAAVAVLPSRDEAMPMFILEAMARRTCVISTTVGGIPAVLSDGHGMLTAPGDADALAEALRLALGDAARRDDLARRGYERFLAEYSAEAVFPRVERIWLAPLGGDARTLTAV